MRNRPRSLRFGVPALFVVGLVAIAWFTVFAPGPTESRNPGPVDIVRTSDASIASAARTMLRTNGIPFTELRIGDDHVLRVEPGAEASAAAQALIALDATALPSAKRISCPTASDVDSRSASDAARNCIDALTVRDLLIASGAAGATVNVERVQSTDLDGPSTTKQVTAQVFFGSAEPAAWDTQRVRAAAADVIGTAPSDVTLVDESLNPLAETVDGSKDS